VAASKETLKVSGYWAATNPVHRLVLTPIMDTVTTVRARYSGTSRKLVVALDIGTTFSGAAYAFLDPGEVPMIQPVTKQVFPLIIDLVTRGSECDHQVPQQPESWVRESSLCVVLRSPWQFPWC